MRDEILEVLEEPPHLWSAAAVGWKLGRPPHGPLAQEADPDVAEALTHLVADGLAVRIDGCPVCARVDVLYATPAHSPGSEPASPSVPWDDAQEAMMPLIAEGLIEVGEIVELVQRECCAHTSRPWRKAPRPA